MKRNNYIISTAKPYLILPFLLLSTVIFFSCEDSLTSPKAEAEITESSSLDDIASGAYVTLTTDSLTVTDAEFEVFDGIRLRQKPDNLEQYGYTPIKVISAPSLWYDDLKDVPLSSLPDGELLHAQTHKAAEVNPEITMVNIEHWPVLGSLEEVQESVKKYYRVIDRMQKVEPGLKFGYWDIVPIKNYNHRITQERLETWRYNNHNIRPLADKVDAFFLNGYTYWQDRTKWAQNLKNNIAEARRLADGVGDTDKPVYICLWPRYYWGFDYDSSLNRTYLESDYWRFQLETARKYADGVLVWTRSQYYWDETAPWVDETKDFLLALGKAS